MNKITLSIAIPAHNEEGNIGSLLESLSVQKSKNYRLIEIVVLSDGSTDRTNEIVKLVSKKDKKIRLRTSRRVGKSRKISHFLASCKSDIVLLLDADITIVDTFLLDKVTMAFSRNAKVGLVGLCDIPKATEGLIAGSISELACTWNEVKEKAGSGQSIHNIHGCAYAMSRNLYKYVNIPKTIFNDDEYAYILNDKLGLNFLHLCRAKVYYSLPKTITDYIRQSSRFGESRNRTIHYFGDNARQYFVIPFWMKCKSMMRHLVLHSVYFIGAMLLQACYTVKRGESSENFSRGYWNIIESTKVTTVSR